MKTRAILAAVAIMVLLPAALCAQSGVTGGRRSVTYYQVTVNANVRGAEIYIDGVLQKSAVPATFELAAGTYEFRLEARGYLSWRQQVTIEGNRTIRAEMLPPTATVIFRVPSDYINNAVRNPHNLIDYYIDGRLQRADRVEVQPGRHTVAIVSGGLRFESQLYFDAGQVYTVELIMRVSLTSSPPVVR